MKIERGIIEINHNETYIVSVGHFFNLNETLCIPVELKNNQKVLGINTGNKFNFCYNFELNSGKTIFGYIINQNSNQEYIIQSIGGYDKQNYNPYDSIFKQLDSKSLKIDEVKSIAIAAF
jgi:hypothetical protein